MRLAALLVLATGCNALVGFDEGKLKVVDAGSGSIDAMPDAMPDATPIDAVPPDAFAGPCDPINQTNCNAGEKCTWITIDQDTAEGVVGCVPDGTVPLAGACTRGPDGATTGFDDCVAGSYCIQGACQTICTQAPDSCDANGSCTLYAGAFTSSGNMGTCAFACDPVTQKRTLDDADACGGGTNVKGCYRQFNEPKAACAETPAAAQSLGHEDTAYDWPNSVFLNGCAPGYAPLLRESTESQRVMCVAYCRPAETHSGATANEGGLPGSGYTCADRGGSGAECKYWWYFMGEEASAEADGLGFCWIPESYVGDWDVNPSTPDSAHPRCTTLSTGDVNGNGTPDHLEYGCAPYQAL